MSDSHTGESKHVVLMAFGLPLMTALIVVGAIYFGHFMTVRSNIPANVVISPSSPKIDVNVPQAAPPNVQVSASPANIDVHVPPAPPPQVNFTAPAAAAPNITVNPPPPTVTIIDRRDDQSRDREGAGKRPFADARASDIQSRDREGAETSKPADAPKPATPPAATPAPASAAPASAPAKPALEAPKPEIKSETAKPKPGTAVTAVDSALRAFAQKAALPAAKPMTTAPVKREEPTLETLYQCAESYVEAYCRKKRLDPAAEKGKWLKAWQAGVEQAIEDRTDHNEQSYINRVVIEKRGCFDMDRATPEKVVEACRIMLRYRDANLTWLSAMREALTPENLRKTMVFLSAGPQGNLASH